MQSARSRGTSRGLAAFCAVFVIAALALAGFQGKQWYEKRDSPRDLEGNAIQFDAGELPSEDLVSQMDVESSVEDTTAADGPQGDEQDSAAQPLRLQIPSVGLDVGVGRLSMVDGIVTPPDFTRAYLIRNLGESVEENSEGTVYMAMHSVRAGNAPGNYLIDVEAGTATVPVSAEVRLGSNAYRVTGFESVAKDGLPGNERTWSNEPDRLVLITCLQRHEGLSIQNVVIYAEKV